MRMFVKRLGFHILKSESVTCFHLLDQLSGSLTTSKMDPQRTTSFAFARSQRRSSIQFGDFPTFEEIQKQSKFGIDRITGARFWFYFRLYLPIYAIGAFVLMFLIPLFLADNDDGFAFYGSLLSLVSCSLVVLSYIHVVPWRRHPSSLMLQISITSLIVSFIVIVKAFPSGKGWLHFNEGGLNLIDANGYSGEGDHTTACQVMSFFIQLALLAREMWVFSLSMDLVTSITNPFASYRASVRKYHMVIWSMAMASATVLVNQPSCQGQFMADGTCWIRISGSQSPCFWGYFLSWVIAFYLFSVLALLYAYMRISKGLESTYATRYACVADTFRVVFFYFGYCIVFYFFLSFIYVQPISDGNIKFVESAYAYFISCRGFFDALVWFFSHGFSSNTDLGMREVAGLTGIAAGAGGSYDGIVDTSTYAQCSRAQLRRQPTLTMADIVPPKPIVRSIYYTARAACRCVAHLIGCSCGVSLASSKSPSADHTGGPDDDDDEEHSDHGEEEGDNPKPSLFPSTHPNHQYNSVPTDPDAADVENPRGRLTGDMKISDVTSRSTRPSGSLWSSQPSSHRQSNLSGLSRPSHLSSTVQSTQSTAQSERDKAFQNDIDLSPQLNFALRAELLYLVTMGIKESVLRLDQRDLHVLMHHTGPAPAGGYSPGNSRSNALHSALSQSYTTNSQSYSFSPGTARAGPGSTNAGANQSGYPHFTRPSTLHREASQNSLLSESGSGHPYAYGQGSPGHSPHSSMRLPANTTHNKHPHNGSFSLNYSQAGSRIQYALRSIQHAVMGTHMPGEYGIDPIVSTQEDYYTHRASQSLNVSPLHTGAHPALSARPSLAPGGRYSLYGPPPALVKVPSLPPDLRNHLSPPAANTAQEAVRNSKESEQTPENKNDSLQSDGDLSYTPSNLQEQLLTENIEMHQQQYFHLPVAAPAEVVFNLNAKHQFRDFRPATFRKLRQMSGLDENRYLELISQPTKERLSEGASGAFFFYCGEGELVVKTVAKHEANTLLKILDKYITYLQSRPESLLVRFLGLHSISMYGNEFQFVVMKNIFPPNVRMNDKYDIKGSWVNRHATRKDPGKRATCKYCNEYFIEGSVDKCPEVVGGHEAIVTLKDSDMINKIRLYPDHAYALIDILNSDSDALCSMGMMDYSLLVGVKTQQYDIDSLQMSQPPLASLPDQQRLSSFSDAPYGSDNHSAAGLSANGNPAARNATITRRATLAYDNIPFETRESHYSESTDPSQQPSQYHTQSYHTQGENTANTHSTPDDSFIAAGYPARAVVAPSTYYLGVIDVLQTWSWSKQMEHWFKVYILQQPAAGVSCVPPEEYKQRYQKKMAGIIEHSIFIREVTGSWRGKRQVSEPFPLMRSSEASGVNSLSISTSNTGPFGGSSIGARLSSAGSGALAGIMEEGRPSETDAASLEHYCHSHSSGNSGSHSNHSNHSQHFNNNNSHHAQKGALNVNTASSAVSNVHNEHTMSLHNNNPSAEGVNLLDAMEDVSPKSDRSCLVSSTPVVLDP